jgi:hypothetical protein
MEGVGGVDGAGSWGLIILSWLPFCMFEIIILKYTVPQERKEWPPLGVSSRSLD